MERQTSEGLLERDHGGDRVVSEVHERVFGGVSVPTDSVLRISCESFCTFHDFLKNPRPLVPEATALPTEPQALPTLFMLFQFHSF